jgi:aryl-alcohol dehydrogenase-like predicted oxidoreductase
VRAELLQPLDLTAEAEVFPLCADQGLGFTAFSPLAGGWLTGKYRSGTPYPDGSRMTLRPEPYRHLVSDATFRGLARLADEARSRGIEMSTLALAWVLHHPRMTAAIVGSRRPAHLDSALAALTVSLSPEEASRLRGLFRPAAP